nr:MAG TPA: Cell Wall Hydrolase [Bacteriophage sp.]
MTEDDVLTLARTVWGEARGEGTEGQKAVIHTVFNRFKSGRWYAGKTIAATCKKPWQYSCWNKNDPNRAKMEELTYIELKPYIDLIEEAEFEPDPTGGATHYYNPKVCAAPKWAAGMRPCYVCGHHLFFKGID